MSEGSAALFFLAGPLSSNGGAEEGGPGWNWETLFSPNAFSVANSKVRTGLARAGSFSRPQVFAVDGGLSHLVALARQGEHLPPCAPRLWSWIGDGDSFLQGDPLVALSDVGVTIEAAPLPTDKDLSDFGAALDVFFVRWLKRGAAMPSEPIEVRVLGGLGGRRDHELCNLFEAADFLLKMRRQGANGSVSFLESPTRPPALSVFTGEVRAHGEAGAGFTLVPLRGSDEASVSGALYSGRISFSRGSRGLSNAMGDAGEVRIATEGVFAFLSSQSSR